MKKVAIMQPYFMPYIGYISLIKHTDEFILFDTAQFIRHGWIERNRILKQGGDWLYIKVPIIHPSRETPIMDVSVNNSENWQEKIKAQLQVYKKTAPYYNDVMQLLQPFFDKEFKTITELNKYTLELVCSYLNIETPIKIFSEMNLSIEPANAPDEWALRICQAMPGVDEYWNPPGGQEFFDKRKYDEAGIQLKFQKVDLEQYDQKTDEFIPGLSIVDVMMFNSPTTINNMLDRYELV